MKNSGIPVAFFGHHFWRAAVFANDLVHGKCLLMTAHIFPTERVALAFAESWIESDKEQREYLTQWGKGEPDEIREQMRREPVWPTGPWHGQHRSEPKRDFPVDVTSGLQLLNYLESRLKGFEDHLVNLSKAGGELSRLVGEEMAKAEAHEEQIRQLYENQFALERLVKRLSESDKTTDIVAPSPPAERGCQEETGVRDSTEDESG